MWPVFLVSNSTESPPTVPNLLTASSSDIIGQLIQADAYEHMAFSYVFSILLFLRLQFWVRAAFVCSQHFEWGNLEASLSGLDISFKCFTWLGVVTLSWGPSTVWAEDWEFSASLGYTVRHYLEGRREKERRKKGRNEGSISSVSNEKIEPMSWLLACSQATLLPVPENPIFLWSYHDATACFLLLQPLCSKFKISLTTHHCKIIGLLLY